MLKEKVQQEIEKLNEDQLKQVESFIAAIKVQSEQPETPKRFWETATKEEWLASLDEWTQQFPKTDVSLSDEACSRESIYDDRGRD